MQKKKIQEDQDQQEGGGEESLVLQEEEKNYELCATCENNYLSIYPVWGLSPIYVLHVVCSVIRWGGLFAHRLI